ncbi:MAG: nicotinate-nucleotide adenylyltransferase [Ignavibacteriaceae bacterium]
MRPVGIFGGTFDPIHIGHLIAAQAVKEIRNLEKIIFIPALISPHKAECENKISRHRFNMVELAIKDIPYFLCSDTELKRDSISYTIDTLRELKNKYYEMELIIGYDNIFNFNTWKEPDLIIEITRLVVLKRSTTVEPIIVDKYYHSATFVDTPTIEISSSDIRHRVANNLSIDFLVHPKVKEYIYKHKLYKKDTL